MKTTNRDKWLLAVIPAILTGIIYIWWTGYAVVAALSQARLQATKAAESITSAQTLELRRMSLKDINDRLQFEHKREEALKSGVVAIANRDPSNWDKAHLALDAVLKARNITLIKSTKLSASGHTFLPAKLEALAKRTAKNGPQEPQYWKLEVAGSYPDMLVALHEMAQCSSFVVPVSIEMERGVPGQNIRYWFLTVWI